MSELLECIELTTCKRPGATVIWLHGLGADGYDFVPLVKEIESRGVAPARYIFPHAPPIAVTINGGCVMRAWYDVFDIDLVRREDESGVRRSQERVEALIEREFARGTPRNRIVLAGFSQGGAIALQTGLRQTAPLAAIVALSGYLPIASCFESERQACSAAVPVFMAHGTQDPIVPVQRATDSFKLLKRLGQAVEWHEYPMPHGLCDKEVEDLAAFLVHVLG